MGDSSYGELVRRELDVLRWLAGHAVDLRMPRAHRARRRSRRPILVESFDEGGAAR